MSEFSQETLLNIIETDHVQCGDASVLARMALAAMESESWCLPLDYLQGHKDGLEWASQLAEANHPDTGDWLYDDPIELAKAIRKGPDMPPAQPVAYSEPVAWTDEEELRDVNVAGIGYLFGIDREANKFSDPRRQIMLYRHAQPAPVVPEEKPIPNTLSMYAVDAVAAIAEVKGWNACRAAMLQAGNSPVNDVTAGKPLTIILPDISSKAFWSGSGKTEVFHPETYRRWVKEAIERGCIIACIDAEVK